jgi:HEAT repeat protein
MGKDKQHLKSLWQNVALGRASADQKIDAACLGAELGDSESVPNIVELLSDGDGDVRYFALQSLVLDLKQKTEEMARRCFLILQEDSEEEVRGMAAACIGSIYFSSKNGEVFKRLKGIVRDLSEPGFVREAAYQAMFSVVGKPPSEWPWLDGPRKVFEESDIDWSLVAQMEDEIVAGSEMDLNSQSDETD